MLQFEQKNMHFVFFPSLPSFPFLCDFPFEIPFLLPLAIASFIFWSEETHFHLNTHVYKPTHNSTEISKAIALPWLMFLKSAHDSWTIFFFKHFWGQLTNINNFEVIGTWLKHSASDYSNWMRVECTEIHSRNWHSKNFPRKPQGQRGCQI